MADATLPELPAGYQPLQRHALDLINDLKIAEERVLRVYDAMGASPEIDGRCVALARTKTQEAFMWAVRAAARPRRLEGDLP